MASTIQCFLVASIILRVLATHACSHTLYKTQMFERHEEWMDRYGRVYKDAAEKEQRFTIFRDNIEFIESFNKASDQLYKLRVNEFADQTKEEFVSSRYGFQGTPAWTSSEATAFKYENETVMPSSMDWRENGAVTPIKNQGHCGCCWAFSAVAAMEGITQLKTGELISLSEQELVDCAANGYTRGCRGGRMTDAFQYIQYKGGLTTEANYPYRGFEGPCYNEMEAYPRDNINSYQSVPRNSEESLLRAVANQPVSVSMDASCDAFKFYSSGVFTGHCGTHLNHAVTAIGYGTTEDGTKYWLVKNSWGTSWGEDGYMRVQRDADIEGGLCGIAGDASYPTA